MRSFEPLSQNDPQWKDTHLGLSDTVTIGQAGCYVTSYAVLSYYYGHPLSPAQVNQNLLSLNLFANQDLISSDDDLQKLYSDIRYLQTNHYENAPADLNLLKDLVSDLSKCVMVEIDLGNDQVHFTPVIDCDGTTVTIMNVWDGQIESLNSVYGDPATKILKFIVYQGTPSAVPAPDFLMEIKQDDYVKLLRKSTELDKIGQGLGFDQPIIDEFGFSDKVLGKFNEAKTSATTPVAPDTANDTNNPAVQALTTPQTNLLLKFLAMVGLKVGA